MSDESDDGDSPEEAIDDFELRENEEIKEDVQPSLVGFLFDDSGHISVGIMSLLVLPYLWASNSRFVLTDQRVVKKVVEWGVGDEVVEEIPVDDVVTINSSQMSYESFFDAGNLQLSTEDGEVLSLYSTEKYRDLGDQIAEMAGVEHNRR